MTSLPRPGIFTTVERQCADSEPTPPLRLFDGSERAGVPLSLVQARRALYDRTVCPTARAALWHQIAERARFDTDESDWPKAVVWLGLPGLRRAAYKITWRFRADRGDVEAELVTCYLEALAKIEGHESDPGGLVLPPACSQAWEVWRKVRFESASDNVEGVGRFPVGADEEGPWQADYDPVPHHSGLSATMRITVPAHRVEGVRLGALARAWGVADTPTTTGYSGRGRQVARISLRRAGRNG